MLMVICKPKPYSIGSRKSCTAHQLHVSPSSGPQLPSVTFQKQLSLGILIPLIFAYQ